MRVTERPDDDPGAAEVVAIGGGGLATSSTLARRWRTRDGGEWHHLVDPRTGRPTDEHWRTVSATGPTCVAANVATTAALVLGAAAVPWLDDHGVSARLVGRDGSVTRTGSWPTPATTPSTDAGEPDAARTVPLVRSTAAPASSCWCCSR